MRNVKPIARPRALEWLNRWKDRDVIKVVTGIRRCGKSTVLAMFRERLEASGVPGSSIVALDLEKMGFLAPRTSRELYDLVVSRMPKEGPAYVVIDEVQRVDRFEEAIDALYAQDNVDLYITGSNSDLLSSELATLLTGRYVELRMTTLSFGEYRRAYGDDEPNDSLFTQYLTYGGFPYTTAIPASDVAEYLDGVLNTILVKDVSRRHPRFDMSAVARLGAFVADNVGNPFSLAKMADALTRGGTKISATTVGEYLDALIESYIVYEVKPYDVKGRALLQRGGKYYLGDLGFRHLMLGHDASDLGHRVENAVYLELTRRYPRVFVGKTAQAEIDFVAESEEGLHYYQVALSVLGEGTLARELAPLQAVADNYPKTLLTLDRVGVGDHAGIEQVNLVDWLLEG